MRKILLLVAVASLPGLCFLTDPLDKVYNEMNLDADLREILAHEAPDSSAYKAITGYLLVSAFSDEPLTGKTYREIVELFQVWETKQQQLEAREKALAERASQEEERRYERLRKVVEVTLAGKEVAYDDSTVRFTYLFKVSNKSDTKIRSLEGFVEMNYGTSATFLRLDLTFSEPMPGSSYHQEKVITTFSRNRPTDQRLKNDPTEEGILVWHPEKILFENGVTLD